MATQNESGCLSNPNFAVICSFMDRYAETLGLPEIGYKDLQEWIEDAKNVHPLLIDLHVRLLRRIHKKLSNVTADRWERGVVKFCYKYSDVDAWEIERFGYKLAKISTKLTLLKNLMESQFDCNNKFKDKINEIPIEEMRFLPVGRDKNGMAYWYFLDKELNLRVYREHQDDVDSESWELVCSCRDDLAKLITGLENGTDIKLDRQESSDQSEVASDSNEDSRDSFRQKTPLGPSPLTIKQEPGHNDGTNSNELKPPLIMKISKSDAQSPSKMLKDKFVKEKGSEIQKIMCKMKEEGLVDSDTDDDDNRKRRRDKSDEVDGVNDIVVNIKQEPCEESGVAENKEISEDSGIKTEEIKPESVKSKTIEVSKETESEPITTVNETTSAKKETDICTSEEQNKIFDTDECIEKVPKGDSKDETGNECENEPVNKTSCECPSDGTASIHNNAQTQKDKSESCSGLEKSEETEDEKQLNDANVLVSESDTVSKTTDKETELSLNTKSKSKELENVSDTKSDRVEKIEENTNLETKDIAKTNQDDSVIRDNVTTSDRCSQSSVNGVEKSEGDSEKVASGQAESPNETVKTKQAECSNVNMKIEEVRSDKDKSNEDETVTTEGCIKHNENLNEKETEVKDTAKLGENGKSRENDEPGKNVTSDKDSNVDTSEENKVVGRDSNEAEGGETSESKKDSEDTEKNQSVESEKPNFETVSPAIEKQFCQENSKDLERELKDTIDGQKKSRKRKQEDLKPEPGHSSNEEEDKSEKEPSPKRNVKTAVRKSNCKKDTNEENEFQKEDLEAAKEEDETSELAEDKTVDESVVKESLGSTENDLNSNEKDEVEMDEKETKDEESDGIAEPPKQQKSARKVRGLVAHTRKNQTKAQKRQVENSDDTEEAEPASKRSKLRGRVSSKGRGTRKGVTFDSSSSDEDNIPLSQMAGRGRGIAAKKSGGIVGKKQAAAAKETPQKKRAVTKKTAPKPAPEPEIPSDLSEEDTGRRRSARVRSLRARRKKSPSPDYIPSELEESDEDEFCDDEEFTLKSKKRKKKEPKEVVEEVPKGRNAIRHEQKTKTKVCKKVVVEEEEEEPACVKCLKSHQPEWILLCDKCDAGYHTACLRPPLMIIPDGDWFCPPCEHTMLKEKLGEYLKLLDQSILKNDRLVRRKERLAFVTISLDNVLKEPEVPEVKERKARKPNYREVDSESNSGSSSETGSSRSTSESESFSDDERSYKQKASKQKFIQRACRAKKSVSYRFEEFDELIMDAIEEDLSIPKEPRPKKVKPPGISRGKDMSNILGVSDEEKEKKPVKKRKPRLTELDVDDDDDTDDYQVSEASNTTDVTKSSESQVSDEGSNDSMVESWRYNSRTTRHDVF